MGFSSPNLSLFASYSCCLLAFICDVDGWRSEDRDAASTGWGRPPVIGTALCCSAAVILREHDIPPVQYDVYVQAHVLLRVPTVQHHRPVTPTLVISSSVGTATWRDCPGGPRLLLLRRRLCQRHRLHLIGGFASPVAVLVQYSVAVLVPARSGLGVGTAASVSCRHGGQSANNCDLPFSHCVVPFSAHRYGASCSGGRHELLYQQYVTAGTPYMGVLFSAGIATATKMGSCTWTNCNRHASLPMRHRRGLIRNTATHTYLGYQPTCELQCRLQPRSPPRSPSGRAYIFHVVIHAQQWIHSLALLSDKFDVHLGTYSVLPTVVGTELYSRYESSATWPGTCATPRESKARTVLRYGPRVTTRTSHTPSADTSPKVQNWLAGLLHTLPMNSEYSVGRRRGVTRRIARCSTKIEEDESTKCLEESAFTEYGSTCYLHGPQTPCSKTGARTDSTQSVAMCVLWLLVVEYSSRYVVSSHIACLARPSLLEMRPDPSPSSLQVPFPARIRARSTEYIRRCWQALVAAPGTTTDPRVPTVPLQPALVFPFPSILSSSLPHYLYFFIPVPPISSFPPGTRTAVPIFPPKGLLSPRACVPLQPPVKSSSTLSLYSRHLHRIAFASHSHRKSPAKPSQAATEFATSTNLASLVQPIRLDRPAATDKEPAEVVERKKGPFALHQFPHSDLVVDNRKRSSVSVYLSEHCQSSSLAFAVPAASALRPVSFSHNPAPVSARLDKLPRSSPASFSHRLNRARELVASSSPWLSHPLSARATLRFRPPPRLVRLAASLSTTALPHPSSTPHLQTLSPTSASLDGPDPRRLLLSTTAITTRQQYITFQQSFFNAHLS
ncbi:hypothetical protein BBK36DRAFT_163046 [Trichoderma citrinoviride]|uniref:Uncharacterized protein n=1 Tax=Trichoderma citrinoviride TaxID=58853 RepID=A0A2T4BB72_9HYPO|nr:hypothetical protein BBK36DRAFT_163046 [Trichoderma citrinoviride]PTB66580.1 hypothetical protein BBK36DRAFT_163046 [Trichoderma citrinoviride]